MKSSLSCIILIGLWTKAICFGAEFQNLGFDDAPIPLAFVGEVLATNALPGWTLSSAFYKVGINRDLYGWADGAILANSFRFPFFFTEGKFALGLNRAQTNSPVFKLSQTGTVPAQAQFLTYRHTGYPLQVEIDGEVLPPLNWPALFPDWASPVTTNLVYDVARFAGREVTLAFSGPFGQVNVMTGNLWAEARMDGIQFVTAAPPLRYRRAGNQLVFSWPASILGYALQSASGFWAFGPTPYPYTPWRNVDVPPVRVGDQETVTLEIGDGNLFFRLGLIPSGLPPPDLGANESGQGPHE